ncbi:Bacterial regulatory proteins, luxR family [Roseovarius albus]|uniref:Bacterial regulatory proteins, luxR family n=1 Tax=Roseovarius albus TaxID=1247867 RepID=A0A1X7A992_9RHOB|nr:LuxR family transcriptional regulator [Roseovarius albus]SLN73345.1 Bacterial regulatory proteins, luxR family [Roseovarius albus]
MSEGKLSGDDLPGGRVVEAGMIGAIAHWCEFLHGKSSYIDALERITVGLDAEAVVLSRVLREDPHRNKILQFDQRRGYSRTTSLTRSYAYSILGRYFDKPKPGSIWFKSMLEHEADPSLEEFQRRRNLVDLAIIPLSVDDKTIDFAEIHFADTLKFELRALLNMVASTLVWTWKNRAPGLMAESFSKSVHRCSEPDVATPILSMSNPAKLSRAEYRVCLFLSRGQVFEQIQSELNISASTLRSHLRNIYAKTDTHSQSELLYRLLSFARAESSPYGHLKTG